MKATKLGMLSALIASICCIGPLLLLLVGLGGLGLGAAIGKYHWLFIAAALGLITFAWTNYLKEKKTCNLNGCQMKNKRITLITLIIASLVIVIFVALNLYTYAVQSNQLEQKKNIEAIEGATVIIPVEGMTCLTCEITVSSALKKVKGVLKTDVSAKTGTATITYDSSTTNVNEIVEAINKTGYKASLP